MVYSRVTSPIVNFPQFKQARVKVCNVRWLSRPPTSKRCSNPGRVQPLETPLSWTKGDAIFPHSQQTLPIPILCCHATTTAWWRSVCPSTSDNYILFLSIWTPFFEWAGCLVCLQSQKQQKSFERHATPNCNSSHQRHLQWLQQEQNTIFNDGQLQFPAIITYDLPPELAQYLDCLLLFRSLLFETHSCIL